MGLQQEIERLSNTAALTAISNDLLAVAHKLRFPMAAILAKVPGDSLAERARAIGVSRQTMYVWAQERFRPSGAVAVKIADLTGVPLAQIADYQEGRDEGETRRGGVVKTPRKTNSRLGKAGRSLSAGAARLRAKRAGLAAQQRKRRHDRKADS
jgi:DNA-binding XRE family transcriptional regulator